MAETHDATAQQSRYCPWVSLPPAAPCKMVLDPTSVDRAIIALQGRKKILNIIPDFLMMDVLTNPGLTTDAVISPGFVELVS